MMMMMMVQNCRGNNRTAPLVVFRGGQGQRLERHFFHFVPKSFLNRCEKANLWAKPFSLLFQVVFSAKLPRLSLQEIFYSFSRAFSSDLFFFAFSSRWELHHQRFLILISLYIYFFLVAQKSFSHHAGARKERSFVCCFWTSSSMSRRVLAAFFFNKMIG